MDINFMLNIFVLSKSGYLFNISLGILISVSTIAADLGATRDLMLWRLLANHTCPPLGKWVGAIVWSVLRLLCLINVPLCIVRRAAAPHWRRPGAGGQEGAV